MDDLLSQLRSQKTEKSDSRAKRHRAKDADGGGMRMSQTALPDASTVMPIESNRVVEGVMRDNPLFADNEEVLEITTSQADMELQRPAEPDFLEYIKRYREEGYITVTEIKRCSEYKIFRPFYAFVRSVSSFGSVYCWELSDETGTIFGSSTEKAPAGKLVCLSNFSLWKVSENHLNIVHENIRELSIS